MLNKYLAIIGGMMLFCTSAEAQTQEKIGLQNIETREVAYCYSNPRSSAEQCAQYFESQGFIRMKHIPYKTANFDFLKVDTFPTRRWRPNELTPRW